MSLKDLEMVGKFYITIFNFILVLDSSKAIPSRYYNIRKILRKKEKSQNFIFS